MPPPSTDGNGSPNPVVQLIAALSALQEPARIAHVMAAPVLAAEDLQLEVSTRQNLEQIADICELLGPSTTRAIRDLVRLLRRDGQDEP